MPFWAVNSVGIISFDLHRLELAASAEWAFEASSVRFTVARPSAAPGCSTSSSASSFALLTRGLRFGAALAQLCGVVVRRARFDELRVASWRDSPRVAHDHVGDRAEQHNRGNQRDDDRFFRVRRWFSARRRFRFLRLRRFFRRGFAELVEGAFGADRAAGGERRGRGGADKGHQQHRARAESRKARASYQSRVSHRVPSITARIAAGNRIAPRETSVGCRAAQTVE
jgi:hypothetical protein